MDRLLTYRYYDTPEGEDIALKSLAFSKYAALSGLVMGTYDVLMYSHPRGLVATVGRYAYFVGPLVGMASAFTVTANVAKNIRGKNDHINYFLGGAVAGSVCSAWQRAPVMAVPLMVLFAAAAGVKKCAVDAGVELFPDIPHMTKTAWSVKHDWTKAQDVEHLKTWTTRSN